MKFGLGHSFDKKQEREMVREYFWHIDKKDLAKASTVKSFLTFPVLIALSDTLMWVVFRTFQTPYIWLFVVICYLFCLYILKEKKKAPISILKISFYMAFSSTMGMFIAMFSIIRVLIMLNDIRFILLTIAAVIQMLGFSLLVSVKVVNWSILKVNRCRIAKSNRKKIMNYVWVFPVLFSLLILPNLSESAEYLLFIVLYVLFFIITVFFASVFGYLTFLVKSFDCADIKV